MSFSQASPDSSTPELLGHNMIGSNLAQNYKKAHHNIQYWEKMVNNIESSFEENDVVKT